MKIVVTENEANGKNINEIESTALIGIIIGKVKYIIVYFSETNQYGLMNSMLGIGDERWFNNDLLISYYLVKNEKVFYFEDRVEHLNWLIT